MQANVGRLTEIAPIATAFFSYQASYAYSQDVVQNDNVLRVFPRVGGLQTNVAYDVSVVPVDWYVEYNDRFGNRVRRSTVTTSHRTLNLLVTGTAELLAPPLAPPDVPIGLYRRQRTAASEYLAESPLVAPSSLAAQAAEATAGAESVLETVDAAIQWVHRHMRYERGHTGVSTTAAEAIAIGFGVCQDFSHVALGLLRALGIPARYVSGLLSSQDAETHAWIEFYHLTEGWLPADPTHMQVTPPPGGLLTFAVGRDYFDVPPVSGSFVSSGGGGLTAVSSNLTILE